MKTYLDCIPCFFTQAIESAKIAGADEKTQRKVVNSVARQLQNFNTKFCPTRFGRQIYKTTRIITGNNDPFLKIKQKSNRFALKLLPVLKQKVNNSKDRLFTALELAIAGNIIDYGIKGRIDLKGEVTKILNHESKLIKNEGKKLFDYTALKKALKTSKKLLYVADNAGEIVFDRVLLEEIKHEYPDIEITFATRGEPIINDVLTEDAYFCGINKTAKVVSSGADCPGAVLELCNKSFLKLYREADLIISKGQGNYEALSEEKGPIFFLFVAKCSVVAKHLNCKYKDILLIKHRK